MMWGCSGNSSMDETPVSYTPLVMSECTAAMVLMNLSCSPTAVKLRAAQQAAASSAHSALLQMNGGDSYNEHHQSDSTSKRHFHIDFFCCLNMLSY
jgi:hypothetical protein